MHWSAIQLGQVAGWGLAAGPDAGPLELLCHGLSRSEAAALAAALNGPPLAGPPAPPPPPQPPVRFAEPTADRAQAFSERRCLICAAPIVGPRRETRVTCGRPCCIVARAHQLRSLTPGQ